MRKWGYGPPEKDQWEKAIRIRDDILASGILESRRSVGTSEFDPLEDVYQTALFMEIYPDTTWRGEWKDVIFRGQRKLEYKMLPNLFRIKSSVQSEPYPSINLSIQQIGGLVRQLQAKHPQITEEEAVAIIQHYSKELGIGTWLIDFTFDPFIALFFASHHGQDGDIGVISYMTKAQFERFSAGGTNRLGKIRLIEPQNIPRISSQRAVFLDTSHPDLYEQLVTFSLYFKQKTGLYFEDPMRTPPVTESTIYPRNDPLVREMKSLKPSQDAAPLAFQPLSDASQPMSVQEYEKIVKSWCISESMHLSHSQEQLVHRLCIFYSILQSYKDEIPITSRSLRRLKEATDILHLYQNSQLKDVTTNFLNRGELTPNIIAAVARLIRDLSDRDLRNEYVLDLQEK